MSSPPKYQDVPQEEGGENERDTFRNGTSSSFSSDNPISDDVWEDEEAGAPSNSNSSSTAPRNRPRPRFRAEPRSCRFCVCLGWTLSILWLLVLSILGLALWKNDGMKAMLDGSTIPFVQSPIDAGSNAITTTTETKTVTKEPSTTTSSADTVNNKDALEELMKLAGVSKPHHQHSVRYNPNVANTSPFDLNAPSTGNLIFPGLPTTTPGSPQTTTQVGYFRQPHVLRDQLVFSSEGDIYITSIPNNDQEKTTRIPAAKLTTSVGNAMHPKLHPSGRFVAYTATYTAHREVYLLDLHSPTSGATRLTYWPWGGGVHHLVGWRDPVTLIFCADPQDSHSVPDARLYLLSLDIPVPIPADSPFDVSPPGTITPIPLAQAIDADVRVTLDGTLCWYFVRYNQPSRTIRYVGGTAESLWKWCEKDIMAAEVFPGNSYNGTTKSPQMFQNEYVFFLSDRAWDEANKKWIPDRMNVWARSLAHEFSQQLAQWIQITDTACDFEGRTIQEYSLDIETGSLVLRIGADMYVMDHGDVAAKLVQPSRLRRSLDEDHDAYTTNATVLTLPPTEEDEETSTSQAAGEDASPPAAGETGDKIPDSGSKNDTTVATSAPAEAPTEAPTTGAPTASPVAKGMVPPKQVDGTGKDTLDNASGIPVPSLNATNSTFMEAEEPGVPVYYNFTPTQLDARVGEESPGEDHMSGTSSTIQRLNIVVHSDFHELQERFLPVNTLQHLRSADVYETAVGATHFLMALRGQLWVAPVVEDALPKYAGGGRNLPERRYRLAPGATTGGSVRILGAHHVPNPVEDGTTDRRLAVILATDPMTKTAEHAFYLIETQTDASPLFLDMDNLPRPFLGGHISGGSTKDGGLGSVKPNTWVVSPCGRRMAWSNTDGQIAVMNMPQYQDFSGEKTAEYVILSTINEVGESMVGTEVSLLFSPGGRYLAVQHNARNQFQVISIADLGDPVGDNKVADISVRRIVQATPSRFNSFGMAWGKTPYDFHVSQRETTMAELFDNDPPEDVATTLYFLSDRDIQTDVSSPWGYREPMPHFASNVGVYALPLTPTTDVGETKPLARFSGGGAAELQVDEVLSRRNAVKALMDAVGQGGRRKLVEGLSGAFGIAEREFGQDQRRLEEAEDDVKTSSEDDDSIRTASFPTDMDIEFGKKNLDFARQAYRVANIPERDYIGVVCQLTNDGSIVVVEIGADKTPVTTIFFMGDYPSDEIDAQSFAPTGRVLTSFGLSTSRKHFYLGFAPDGQYRVVPNTLAGVSSLLSDLELDDSIPDVAGLHLSVVPTLEYRQLYDDAWRMLRDYYYDVEMTGIDWDSIHERYVPLVSRCTKREELDDVLAQMASELSALHVFVYGGEYSTPFADNSDLQNAHALASLGASLKRAPEYSGYEIKDIPERDPDFGLVDGVKEVYSPLSSRALALSGQKGLEKGDVIVAVNGESTISVPDIHMLLRGTAGTSVRLDVLRPSSGEKSSEGEYPVEPVIVVPLDSRTANSLLYSAWEWKTEQHAQDLAAKKGFSVGYVHLKSMSGPSAENAFARGFFPNYHKDAFILDVRHNVGGNIDSWVLDVLQRRPWMYWEDRAFNPYNGGLGWDEQYAFRGHIVVLINEKTSSDGEGVARGISELGLGKLIGTRTWGGGIWLSSENDLVDGGIATAPEMGTYNENFGWGLGVEQMGVDPDIVVDNEPHSTYKGGDTQLERAIDELKKWLDEEPIVKPKPPAKKKDMTMGDRECVAKV